MLATVSGHLSNTAATACLTEYWVQQKGYWELSERATHLTSISLSDPSNHTPFQGDLNYTILNSKLGNKQIFIVCNYWSYHKICVGHIMRYLLQSSFLKEKETTSEDEVLYSYSQIVSHDLLLDHNCILMCNGHQGKTMVNANCHVGLQTGTKRYMCISSLWKQNSYLHNTFWNHRNMNKTTNIILTMMTERKLNTWLKYTSQNKLWNEPQVHMITESRRNHGNKYKPSKQN